MREHMHVSVACALRGPDGPSLADTKTLFTARLRTLAQAKYGKPKHPGEKRNDSKVPAQLLENVIGEIGAYVAGECDACYESVRHYLRHTHEAFITLARRRSWRHAREARWLAAWADALFQAIWHCSHRDSVDEYREQVDRIWKLQGERGDLTDKEFALDGDHTSAKPGKKGNRNAKAK